MLNRWPLAARWLNRSLLAGWPLAAGLPESWLITPRGQSPRAAPSGS